MWIRQGYDLYSKYIICNSLLTPPPRYLQPKFNLINALKSIFTRTARRDHNGRRGDFPSLSPIYRDSPILLPTTIDLGSVAFNNFLSLHSRSSLSFSSSSNDHPDHQKVAVIKDISRSNDLLPSACSRDAGTYYCNEIYYRTVWAVRKHGILQSGASKLLPVIFVHIPSLNPSLGFTVESISKHLLQLLDSLF